MICEIGGTVGDIEGAPFLEAIRQLGYKLGRERALFLHLTLVPYIAAAGELKTKPTQHSVKELQSVGIHPDILLCRADREIPENERAKIALFCNLDQSAVIQALDVDASTASTELPEEGLDREVLRHFNLTSPEPDLSRWQEIVKRVTEPEGKVTIGVVGKYVNLLDAYKSLAEALTHGGIANNAKVEMRWIDSEIFEEEDPELHLSGVHGILVPGGFGERGSSGKIAAVRHAQSSRSPTSVSASACRWQCWRWRGTSPASKTQPLRNSARPTSRLSA